MGFQFQRNVFRENLQKYHWLHIQLHGDGI